MNLTNEVVYILVQRVAPHNAGEVDKADIILSVHKTRESATQRQASEENLDKESRFREAVYDVRPYVVWE